ncbi:two-component system, chemotaxis family, sensor kinase CheA [Lachnospiraceae bacterium G11]|nr:two-component system, chemotaxis family, sensor kinase CheA [Lachnospiraceae bacterium G11]
MLDMYLFENSQLLEQLQDRVLKLKDAESFDDDSINEIFRAIHTIKGSSGVMMFDEITAVAHKLEDVFYYLRESKPTNVPHLELVELVLGVTDFISGEMDKLSEGAAADGDAHELIGKIDDYLRKIKESENEAGKVIADNVYEEPTQFYIAPLASSFTHYYKVYITYKDSTEHVNIRAFKAVRALKDVAEDMLYYPEDILSGKEAVTEDIRENGFKILIQTDKAEDELKKLIGTDTDIQNIDVYECNYAEFNLGFVSDTSQILIDLDSSVEEIIERSGKQETPGAKYVPEVENIVPGDFVVKEKGHGKVTLARDRKSEARRSSYISVEVSKLDRLMELIDKLVAKDESEEALELQRAVKAMRVVPLTSTFQKMNRIVFDISRKLGKDVGFEMIGDTTEIDKNIVEHISDPLMHIVRNAVDHGIETPAERKMAGKTERGKITLSAGADSGEVWIKVSDNGRGLDRNVILARAREQGFIDDPVKPDDAYNDKEVFGLITRPGFSTSENVTEYSGRGVGMDVVMQNIGDLGGTLEIESTKGFGTVFTMKFKKL